MIKKHNLSHLMMFLLAFCTLLGMGFFGSSATASTTLKSTIHDSAGMLDAVSVSTLEQKAKEIEKKTDTAIYIWTDAAIGGSDNYERVAENIVTTLGDANNNCVILFIGTKPGDRIYVIQGYGKAKNYINSTRADHIADHMQSQMRSENYLSAFHIFLDETQADLNSDPKFDLVFFAWWFQLLAAIIIVILFFAITILNAGGKNITTEKTYMDTKNSRLLGEYSHYTHTTVTRTHNSSSSGGGGGGGHSSSGGHSF